MASDRKASRTSESIDGPTGLLSLCLLLSLIHHAPAVQSFQPVSLPQQLLQPPPSSIRCNKSPIALHALSQRQTFLLDGGELESFLVHNNDHNVATIAAGNAVASPRNAHKGVGCLSFVTGTTDDQKRIVGVEQLGSGSGDDAGTNYETISLGDGIHVYKHTVAVIPERVSDMDAISTAAASVVGVHCAIPRVGGVGGSDDGVVFGKAVVVGGNDYACFVADGLATLGIDVSLVSTGGVNIRNNQVKTMSPSVEIDDDSDEVGFTTAIGQFDSLVDTISNERKGMVDITSTSGSSVLQLLKSRNQCHKYISTLTKSQQMVKSEGVFFGPGKANAHLKFLESISPQKCTTLIPSLGFGPSTVQTLLENNVLFTLKNNKATASRGWSLKDFWEETSWPRDSSGTGVRFGLPVLEEEEDLEETFQIEQLQIQQRVGGNGRKISDQEEEEANAQSEEDQPNPFVKQIVGVDGLAENVISKRKSCVIFVAMRSCRTCKGISPVFTRLAREHGTDLMFAKADATGTVGKALGKQLAIDAVPSFVLFRDGVRYGAVSTSKLPSVRLERAIRDLEAGKEFDTLLEEDQD